MQLWEVGAALRSSFARQFEQHLWETILEINFRIRKFSIIILVNIFGSHFGKYFWEKDLGIAWWE